MTIVHTHPDTGKVQLTLTSDTGRPGVVASWTDGRVKLTHLYDGVGNFSILRADWVITTKQGNEEQRGKDIIPRSGDKDALTRFVSSLPNWAAERVPHLEWDL